MPMLCQTGLTVRQFPCLTWAVGYNKANPPGQPGKGFKDH